MITAGFGFRAGTSAQSLQDALDAALASAGQDRTALGAIATAADKAETPGFQIFAQTLGLAPMGIDPAVLGAQTTDTHSPASQAARGTGSVAEAAALALAGPQARLLQPRVISTDKRATCALATGD